MWPSSTYFAYLPSSNWNKNTRNELVGFQWALHVFICYTHEHDWPIRNYTVGISITFQPARQLCLLENNDTLLLIIGNKLLRYRNALSTLINKFHDSESCYLFAFAQWLMLSLIIHHNFKKGNTYQFKSTLFYAFGDSGIENKLLWHLYRELCV